MGARRIAHLRQKVANLGWLTAEQVFRLALGLLIATLVARHLGPSDFSVFAFVTSICAMLVPLANFSSQVVVLRDVSAAPEQEGLILGTALVIGMVAASLATIAGILALLFLPSPTSFSLALAAPALLSVFLAPTETVLAVLRAKELAARIALPRIAVAAIIAGLTVWAAIGEKGLQTFFVIRGIEAIAYAIAAIGAILTVQTVVQKINFSKVYCRNFVKAAFPLTISGLATTAFLRVDQVMLGLMASANELGQYGVAVRVVDVANVLPSLLIATLFPAVVRNSSRDRDEFAAFMHRMFDTFQVAGVGAIIGLFFCAAFLVIPVFGQEYGRAAFLVMMLAIGCPFFFQYWLLCTLLTVEERINAVVGIALGGAGLNITLNLILIPYLGAAGAAIATIATLILISHGYTFVFEKKLSPARAMLKSINPVMSFFRLYQHVRSNI